MVAIRTGTDLMMSDLTRRLTALEAVAKPDPLRLDMTGLTDDELQFVESLAPRMVEGYEPNEAEANRWRDIDQRIVRRG